ncbi:leucine-rich repeat-containing protein 29 isoform X7 [Heterocephalus glaber]|uniref:Leucine-rich repeat-containing protein 29 isoform X7 n=1 Tax=Heterocephalus glaber TaxID=10181 RepID=A0AAX6QTB7_HETGA|nr:leucine-rich repeat-containing protein 29 isoform X7 [Heterocephalus glaber]
MAESLPLEMLTYILSFLPLSDQKEASLVSRAWYCAAQNALRELHPILGSSSALLKSERGTRTLDPQPHLKGICLLSLGRTTIQSMGALLSGAEPTPKNEFHASWKNPVDKTLQKPILPVTSTLLIPFSCCSVGCEQETMGFFAVTNKVLQFPQLRQLSLSLLPALTDNGLVAVARGCPSLEHLSLSHCSCLSDDDWAQAAGSWLRLQHLNLSSCSQLTEQTLDTNSQVCKQLQVLDVAMCPGINVVAVRHFQAQLPQVTCEGLT